MLFRNVSAFSLLMLACISCFTGCSSRSSYVHTPRGASGSSEEAASINNSPAMHRATMRPYTIDGKTYYPTMVSVGDYFSGVASWYGKDFHGKKTSNGEVYNMYDLTAAHKTLPMNTMLKVTNLKNNKSIVVRVNDRGPFVGTRIIDLSYTAASRLELVANGTGPVGLEVIGFAGVVAPAGAPKESVVESDYFIQIGAFRSKEGAARFAQSNMNVNNRYNAVVKEGTFENQPIYRVWLKGFGSEAEASDFIAKGQFKGSFIVRE
ncbi:MULTISPECIES: septal ring lytic transglycosylase RlpA family protein [unclassified Sulfurospirillum]|nr:septal ring lytic transglycosylase RlpA family protein [Sulfurospirillum sp. MES]MCP3651797.1 septal ring lytic transglycosylase RlpA family protein [Sulfurospirillum sp. DNRA8]MCR1810644.1 septal ring lytic transglycosylase RlpA family protein [Sulfurospirillum sp. DNRA8]